VSVDRIDSGPTGDPQVIVDRYRVARRKLSSTRLMTADDKRMIESVLAYADMLEQQLSSVATTSSAVKFLATLAYYANDSHVVSITREQLANVPSKVEMKLSESDDTLEFAVVIPDEAEG
jgi:hypothetical protein